MFFCKGQCDFSTCNDSVCLLSNLVEHELIAYGPLGSFFFCYSIVYFTELLTTKIQNKSANIESGLPVSRSWIFE